MRMWVYARMCLCICVRARVCVHIDEYIDLMKVWDGDDVKKSRYFSVFTKNDKHNTELQRKPSPANQSNMLYTRCIINQGIIILRYTIILNQYAWLAKLINIMRHGTHLWRLQMTSSVSKRKYMIKRWLNCCW